MGFSGGRDSSAILAVATHLARRHGALDPIPVTEIYPGVAESDESEWQRLVIDHLGLRDWVCIKLAEGNDFLGSPALESLRLRGLLWPPALHLKPRILAQLSGGTFLTGEGGDEVLGRRRGAQVSRLWRRGTRPSLGSLRAAVGATAPEQIRRRRIKVHLDESAMQPWVRAEALERHHRLMAADMASEPLSTARSLEWLLTRRTSRSAEHNYTAIAAELGITLCQPFLTPGFIRALARDAGRWGFHTRTDAMRALFSDVLPEAVLARRGKAYFNRAFMGEETSAFAERWDGCGVDHQTVDAEALRAEWLSEMPSAISSLLLQAAWLGSEGAAGARADTATPHEAKPIRAHKGETSR